VRWWRRARTREAAGPRDVSTAIRRALIAVLDRDLDAGEVLLTEALQRDSREVDAYLALARLYRQRGEIGRSIHLHQNLMLRRDLTDEGRFLALLGLADDFRAGGFLRRAIAAYEEVLAERPRHLAALRALVGLFVDVREPARAIPLATRLARLEDRESGDAEAGLLVDLAECERAEGRSEAARKALRRALRRDPNRVRAWIALGQVESELGRTAKALAAWRRVPAIDRSAGAAVYPRLAASFASLGRAREHEAFLRELLESQPEDAVARLALARALAGRGDVEEALGEVRRVLEREPDHLEAHAALGRILLADARTPELAKAHEELLDVLERRGMTVTGDLGDALA
jgi:lipopolysaccharide biosynthesis regulator YciM